MRSDRIYSILSAFPAMMLIGGLIYYYSNQSAETDGELIKEKTVELVGTFKGFSKVNPNSLNMTYLWITTPKRDRGARLMDKQVEKVRLLKEGDEMRFLVAPRVEGSKTLWGYRVESKGVILLDD